MRRKGAFMVRGFLHDRFAVIFAPNASIPSHYAVVAVLASGACPARLTQCLCCCPPATQVGDLFVRLRYARTTNAKEFLSCKPFLLPRPKRICLKSFPRSRPGKSCGLPAGGAFDSRAEGIDLQAF